MKHSNKKYLKTFTIIAVTLVLVKLIVANPPKSQRGSAKSAPLMVVAIDKVSPQSYQVVLDSFGTVQPRTQSALVAQVSGQITSISNNFREGEFFKKGEILVSIDDRDYQAELKIAQAGVLNAEQALVEEKARVEQALKDWKRLGNGEKASALVLRKPQLAAAKAQLLSAQAKYEKAQLSLERTQIIAPYDGRILNKQVDVGQVVSSNTKLANIFATDIVEIRLPIHNSDLQFIDLPEQYRKSDHNEKLNLENNSVFFTSDLAPTQRWQGQLIRTAGSIDDKAQQLYVVAQIENPFKQNNTDHNKHGISIKIGQYLDAKIQGKLLEHALVIPNTSIYQGSYVYIVEQGLLKRQEITIAWQNDQQALISSGLEFGQQLVLTSLGQISSGTKVEIVGQKKTLRKGSQFNKRRNEKHRKHSQERAPNKTIVSKKGDRS
ncbi:MAG: efflux transporter periplasmic adaptor subunit [Gammaproteobacteria bacterium]|nr:MAG: efflux transporter periplasmic adaptor subunit [Gammaproteobacteria bacterium]